MPSRDFSVCSSHLRPQAAHRSHLGDLGVSVGLRRSLWNAALCLGYPRLTRVHISFEPWPFYLRDKSQNVTPKRELLWVAVSICSVTSSLERNCQESFFQTFFLNLLVFGLSVFLAFPLCWPFSVRSSRDQRYGLFEGCIQPTGQCSRAACMCTCRHVLCTCICSYILHAYYNCMIHVLHTSSSLHIRLLIRV